MVTDQDPFDLIERSFQALRNDRRPPVVAGVLLGSVHAGRVLSVVELRTALLCHGTPPAVRNRVVVELVRRARGGEPWRTAVAGVLLPGLRSVVGPLLRAYPEYEAELEAEALVGLFDAVRTTRLDRDRLAVNLLWAARRSADRLLDHELAEANPSVAALRVAWTKPDREGRSGMAECDGSRLAAPLAGALAGHPELVLVEACEAGVLSATEVELISETRLERRSVRRYAESVGGHSGSLRMKRYRAEQRLVRWVLEGKPPCKKARGPCFRSCGTSEPVTRSEPAGPGCHVDTERTETEDGTRPRRTAPAASTS